MYVNRIGDVPNKQRYDTQINPAKFELVRLNDGQLETAKGSGSVPDTFHLAKMYGNAVFNYGTIQVFRGTLPVCIDLIVATTTQPAGAITNTSPITVFTYTYVYTDPVSKKEYQAVWNGYNWYYLNGSTWTVLYSCPTGPAPVVKSIPPCFTKTEIAGFYTYTYAENGVSKTVQAFKDEQNNWMALINGLWYPVNDCKVTIPQTNPLDIFKTPNVGTAPVDQTVQLTQTVPEVSEKLPDCITVINGEYQYHYTDANWKLYFTPAKKDTAGNWYINYQNNWLPLTNCKFTIPQSPDPGKGIEGGIINQGGGTNTSQPPKENLPPCIHSIDPGRTIRYYGPYPKDPMPRYYWNTNPNANQDDPNNYFCGLEGSDWLVWYENNWVLLDGCKFKEAKKDVIDNTDTKKDVIITNTDTKLLYPVQPNNDVSVKPSPSPSPSPAENNYPPCITILNDEYFLQYNGTVIPAMQDESGQWYANDGSGWYLINNCKINKVTKQPGNAAPALPEDCHCLQYPKYTKSETETYFEYPNNFGEDC